MIRWGPVASAPWVLLWLLSWRMSHQLLIGLDTPWKTPLASLAPYLVGMGALGVAWFVVQVLRSEDRVRALRESSTWWVAWSWAFGAAVLAQPVALASASLAGSSVSVWTSLMSVMWFVLACLPGLALTALPSVHGTLPSVTRGRGPAMALGVLLALGLAPSAWWLWGQGSVGAAVGLFAGGTVALWSLLGFASRPSTRSIHGAIVDSGRGFGHDWVFDQAGVVWVDADQAAALREAPAVGPVWRPTAAGQALAVPPSRVRWPVSQASLWTCVMLGLPTAVTGMVWAVSGPGSGSIAELLMLAVLVLVVTGLTVGLSLIPVALLAVTVQALAQVVARAGDGATVERIGRVLRTSRGSFTMGETDQVVRLSHTWRGPCLTLSNHRERLMLRGQHQALKALADEVAAVEALGAPEDVPEALRAAVQQRRQPTREG